MVSQIGPMPTRDGKPPAIEQRTAPPPEASRDEKPPEKAGGSWWPLIVLVAVVLALAGLFTAGLLPRLGEKKEAKAAQPEGPPSLNVAIAKAAPAEVDVSLPGTTRAYEETALFARTNGFLEHWHVEMGARVTEGQLLAEIATPELDRELDQSRASLAQTKASLVRAKAEQEVNKATLDRLKRLISTSPGAGTRQELDEREGAFRVGEASISSAEANIKAGEANVKRLEELQSFQKVRAPFAGVVTARNVDRGALISAGNSGSSAPMPTTGGTGQPMANRELFRVAQTDPLRIIANVPQVYAPAVKVGGKAEIKVREHPGRVFTGTVSRTANALDPQSRTLNTEVQVANGDGTLLPGMYIRVLFKQKRERPPVMIPAGALLTRPGPSTVALVGDGDKLTYRVVEISRDFGGELEIVNGLSGGERLVLNLSEDLPEGTAVTATEVPTPAGK